MALLEKWRETAYETEMDQNTASQFWGTYFELEKEIKAIKERNKRVETDKAWETSWTRRICICVLTYLVVVCYSWLISKVSNIWLSSLVPVIGFTLSTLSLTIVRKIWEKGRK